MRNERAWPQQCWKNCANGSNIVALHFGDHGTKEMLGVVGWKGWPVSNFAQQHATTCNRVSKRTQHVTSNNGVVGRQCCVRLHGALQLFSCSLRKKRWCTDALFWKINNNLRIMMRVSVMLETTKDMRGKCVLYTFWWKLCESVTGR